MADSIRPRIKGTSGSPAFYQVGRPPIDNSDRDALGVIYPLFFLGSVIIAVALYTIRAKQQGVVTGPGLIVNEDVAASFELLPNLVQRISQLEAGTFDPQGQPIYPSAPGAPLSGY